MDGALGFAPICREKGKCDKYGPGGNHFASINIKAGHLIVEAPLQNITKKEAYQDNYSGRIGPDNGQIGDNECPGSQKGMVMAHYLLHIGIEAAVIAVFLCQFAEVGADNQHGYAAQGNGEDAAHRAGMGQKEIARHHKGTPSHGTAEGQCPNI